MEEDRVPTILYFEDKVVHNVRSLFLLGLGLMIENTSKNLMRRISDMTLLRPYHFKLKKYGFYK